MNLQDAQLKITEAKSLTATGAYQPALVVYQTILAQTTAEQTAAIREIRRDALIASGKILYRSGQQQASLEIYQQLYLESDNNDTLSDALILIGQQQSRMGNQHDSLEANKEALTLSEANNYTAGRAQAFAGIAVAYGRMTKPEEALPYLQKAQALFLQLEDREAYARTINWLGITYHNLGRFDKAISAYLDCIAIAEQTDNNILLSKALNNLGESHLYMFDFATALAYHKQGLAVAETIELIPIQADLNRNIGMDLRFLNQLDEAVVYLQKGLSLAEKTNQPDLELDALYALALVHLQMNDIMIARHLAMKLQSLAGQYRNKKQQIHALFALGLCHEQENELAASHALWQQAAFMAEESHQRYSLWQLHAALGRVAPSPEVAEIHLRMANEVIEQIIAPIEDKQLQESFLNSIFIQNITKATLPID